MWRLKDFIINSFLRIRLWLLIRLNPKRFKGKSNNVEKKGWELTFSDEFDQGSLDKSKWTTQACGGLRFHPESIIDDNKAPTIYYADDCFEFKDSIMRQLIKNIPIEIEYMDLDDNNYGKFTIPYQTGQIDCSNYFEQKYGYFEIRSKASAGKGVCSSFWMASNKLWPPEIDVYEICFDKKSRFESNFIWKSGGWDERNNRKKSKVHKVLDASEDFHIYAVEWNKNRFKIYYDNVLIRVFSNPKALSFFSFPMHLIIGADVYEDNHQKIENSRKYHEIDYVRVYNKK